MLPTERSKSGGKLLDGLLGGMFGGATKKAAKAVSFRGYSGGTKTPLEMRRAKNRRKNKAAKVARKASKR